MLASNPGSPISNLGSYRHMMLVELPEVGVSKYAGICRQQEVHNEGVERGHQGPWSCDRRKWKTHSTAEPGTMEEKTAS